MQVRIDPYLAMPIKLAAVKKGMSVPKLVNRLLRSALKRMAQTKVDNE